MRRNFKFFLFFLLILANSFVWQAIFNLEKGLAVSFFDIGQGDAIFIETTNQHQILIDGGPKSEILEKLAKEMPFWDKSIDLIILTHPEKDHLEGLLEVLKRYKVENILWTGVKKETLIYQEWQKAIEKEKAKIFIAKADQKIKAGKVIIYILYPFESLEGKETKNANDTSIVSKLIFNENSFLFTGDISKSIEEKLVQKYKGLNSNVLKVAHHGSKNSTSKLFLEKVSPEIAVISCGENNPYNHPHLEVLQNLSEFGIKILRTDKNGDIKIISDGNQFQIIKSKSK